jgi:hypothetical protein
MKKTLAAAALVCFAAALIVTSLQAAGIKSGPQVGEKVPGPFHPLNINGEKAGEKNCLYCSNGDHPVAMVFARECSEPLAKLIKKIDETTVKNKSAKMGSFVVFCNDDEGLKDKLTQVAKDANLKETILAIDNPAGPQKYNVSKDADVTVVLYVDREVKANHSFKKGELTEKDIETVLSDVSKILPSK